MKCAECPRPAVHVHHGIALCLQCLLLVVRSL